MRPIAFAKGSEGPEMQFLAYNYQYEDTVIATDDEYERLKAAYIARFGGWETIDLEHTTYDGHKWY